MSTKQHKIIGIEWEDATEESPSLLVIRGVHPDDAAAIISRVMTVGRVFGDATAPPAPSAPHVVSPPATAAQIAASDNAVIRENTGKLAEMFGDAVKAALDAPLPPPPPAVEETKTDAPKQRKPRGMKAEDGYGPLAALVEKRIGAPVRVQTVAAWTSDEREQVSRWVSDDVGNMATPPCVRALLPSTEPDPWKLSPDAQVEDVSSAAASASEAANVAAPVGGAYDLDALKASTRVVDVVKTLFDAGFNRLDSLVAECERLKPQVAVLSRVPDMKARIERTLDVANIKLAG